MMGKVTIEVALPAKFAEQLRAMRVRISAHISEWWKHQRDYLQIERSSTTHALCQSDIDHLRAGFEAGYAKAVELILQEFSGHE